jgi:ribose 5-phosphate isomerase A
LGASLTVRGGEEAPYITDNGNLILDLKIEGGLHNAPEFAKALKTTTGVAEHGLFIGMADTCIIGSPDGPQVLGKPSAAPIGRPKGR